VAFPNEKQKIFMITGKGGVGKSTIAAALAQKEARSGRKTLLVELGEQSYFQYVYDKPIYYEPTPVEENLSISLWSGEACLREYVYYLIKVKTLVDLFFDNRVMRTFIKAAPALKELAVLGKITSGIRQWGPPLNFDVIIVDAFATGHFLALLKAPIGMGELIESGPMGEQSRNIQSVLKRPDLCEYKIVTLPEELPVTEAIELVHDLKKLLGVHADVICNRVYRTDISESELSSILKTDRPQASQQFAEFLINLLSRQSEQLANLKKAVGSVVEIPLILASRARDVVGQIEMKLR
jgi:anion-transporting  ArsA/GET3 family ATPase